MTLLECNRFCGTLERRFLTRLPKSSICAHDDRPHGRSAEQVQRAAVCCYLAALTEGSCWRVARLLGQISNEGLAWRLPDALAHAVKDLASSDPVQGGSGAKGGKHISRCCKHGLVEGGQERPEDDHASWRNDIGDCPAQALAGIAEELSNCLEISNLHQEKQC